MNRRPLVAGALAAVAVATTGLLSACGAGQLAQTAQVQPGVPGINTQAPDGRQVYVRNAALDYSGPKGYAQGANAPMSLWIFNDTQQVVTLVGVAGIQVVAVRPALVGLAVAVPLAVAQSGLGSDPRPGAGRRLRRAEPARGPLPADRGPAHGGRQRLVGTAAVRLHHRGRFELHHRDQERAGTTARRGTRESAVKLILS